MNFKPLNLNNPHNNDQSSLTSSTTLNPNLALKMRNPFNSKLFNPDSSSSSSSSSDSNPKHSFQFQSKLCKTSTFSNSRRRSSLYIRRSSTSILEAQREALELPEPTMEDEDQKEELRLEKEFQKLYSKSLHPSSLLSICKKTPFELIESIDDSVALASARKSLLFVSSIVSWISGKLITSVYFEYLSLGIIIWNCFMLATQNEDFELMFTALYTVEMTLKILGMGFVVGRGSYLRDRWNIMDFIIVISSLIPLFVERGNSVNISVLRSFRMLRPLRTISSVKRLRVLIQTILSSLPMLMETLIILSFFFLIFAIAGLQLYSGILKKRCFKMESGIELLEKNNICGYNECPLGYICGKMIANPNWGITNFDTIFYSLQNVFLCVTLEGWWEISVYVGKALHPLTNFYFVVLIFLGSFFLINLTLAVIKLKFTESHANKKAIPKGFKTIIVQDISYDDLKIWKAKERKILMNYYALRLKDMTFGCTSPKDFNNCQMLELFEAPSIIKKNFRQRKSDCSQPSIINHVMRHKFRNKIRPLTPINTFKVKGYNFKGIFNEPTKANESDLQAGKDLESIIEREEEEETKRNSPRHLDLLHPELFVPSKNTSSFTIASSSKIPSSNSISHSDNNQSLSLMLRELDISRKSREEINSEISLGRRAVSSNKSKERKSKRKDRASLVAKGRRKSHIPISPFNARNSSATQIAKNGSEANIRGSQKLSHSQIVDGDPIFGSAEDLKSMKSHQSKSSMKFPKRRDSLSQIYKIQRADAPVINQPKSKSFLSGIATTLYKEFYLSVLKRTPDLPLNQSNHSENRPKEESRRSLAEARRPSLFISSVERKNSIILVQSEPNYNKKAKFYKFEPQAEIKYESSSFGDVLYKLLRKKTKMEEEHQKKIIKSARYTQVFNSQLEYLAKRKEKSKEQIQPRVSAKFNVDLSPKKNQFSSKILKPSSLTKKLPLNFQRSRRITFEKPHYTTLEANFTTFTNQFSTLARLNPSKSMSEESPLNPKSRRRLKTIDLIYTYESACERMNRDFPLDPEDSSTPQVSNEEIFRRIQVRDFETLQINMHNFSAFNVCESSKSSWSLSHIRSLSLSLNSNSQNFVIWIPGLRGLVKYSKHQIHLFVNSSSFDVLMNLCVVLNTAVLAMEGLFEDEGKEEEVLGLLNFYFTIVFSVEMMLKIVGLGIRGYVREKMNVFEGVIVVISVVELSFSSGGQGSSISAFRSVRILRTFRVLRVTRLLTLLSFMKIIINVISNSLSDFIYIALLLILFIFIYSLLGMQMFANELNFADSATRMNYDSFFEAFLATFQVLTVENWQQILYTTLRSSVNSVYSCLYLLSWIILGHFMFLNLFLAILLDGFTQEQVSTNPSDDHSFFENAFLEEPPIESYIGESKDLLKDDAQNEFELSEIDEEEREVKFPKLGSRLDTSSDSPNFFCDESLFLFSQKNPIRILFIRLVRTPEFDNFILLLIFASTIKLIVDTYLDFTDPSTLSISTTIDIIFTLCFTLEAIIKIVSFGFFLDQKSYLRENWNILDFLIVVSSIIDFLVENVEIPVVKVLRLLRTLRPLRFITHNIELRIVVTALMESVSAILNVGIVVLIVWLMFAIVGMSLLSKKMYRCNGEKFYEVSRGECEGRGGQWVLSQPNFSNIFHSMIALFILSTQEGWTDIMFQVIDARGEQGPKKDSNPSTAYFVIAFLLIGSFFLMNLFVGVIFFNFMKAHSSEQASAFLTSDQQHWIDITKKIPSESSNYGTNKWPSHPIRRFVYKIVSSNNFDFSILGIIFLNVIVMAIEYEGASLEYLQTLEHFNLAFTSIFILESSLKIFAFGLKAFWFSPWNRFDSFVVAVSIFDFLMSQFGNGVFKFFKSGSQLARVVKVLRVTRLLKLVKALEGLQKILETLLITLPSIMNIGALLLIVFFIYSLLGVTLFGEVSSGDVIDEWTNFQNFGNALLILFRCSTGEDWYKVMGDLSRKTSYAYGYFLSFLLICNFIMLNLFILIIIQQFEDRSKSSISMSEDYKEYLDVIRKNWALFSSPWNGVKISQRLLTPFLKAMPPPLGFDPKVYSNKAIAREISKMSLKVDCQGYLFFNDVLFGVMRNALFPKENLKVRKEVKFLIEKAEFQAKKKIRHNKKNLKATRASCLTSSETAIIDTLDKKPLNPILELLYLGMIFKSWLKFSESIEKGLENDPNFKSKFLRESNWENSSEKSDLFFEDEEEEEESLSFIEESIEDESSSQNT